MTDGLLDRFRALHDRRKRGTLRNGERQEYDEGCARLLALLLVAQKAATPQGGTVRAGLRAAFIVGVEIESATGIERTMTLDVSVGGFAVFAAAPRPLGDLVRFTLQLPESANVMAEVSGTARVTSCSSQALVERIGFAFVGLHADAKDALERALLDHVLSRLDEEEGTDA